MKKKRGKDGGRFSPFILAAFVFALLSCGGPEPSGPPGSWGAEDTNVVVNVGLELDSASVDICNAAGTGAKASFATSPANQELPENTLYLEKYTVEFSPLTEGAPPIETSTIQRSAVLPFNGLPLIFMDAAKKAKYVSDITTGGYKPASEQPLYTVKYSFSGKDKWGVEFGVAAISTFDIGKFGGCDSPLLILPFSISLKGVANPDDDPSDDVTFHIAGGSAPYTVYSDNPALINAPGALALGVSTFSIEPDSPASETVVTLTAVDRKGATAIAKVTLK